MKAQIQILIPNKHLGCGYKGLVLCRNNDWIMENLDMGLTVPKWALIVCAKIPQMPQNLSAICTPKPKNSGLQWKKKASSGVRSPCTELYNFLPNSIADNLLTFLTANIRISIFGMLLAWRKSFPFQSAKVASSNRLNLTLYPRSLISSVLKIKGKRIWEKNKLKVLIL